MAQTEPFLSAFGRDDAVARAREVEILPCGEEADGILSPAAFMADGQVVEGLCAFPGAISLRDAAGSVPAAPVLDVHDRATACAGDGEDFGGGGRDAHVEWQIGGWRLVVMLDVRVDGDSDSGQQIASLV